jgi:hypothetical protein
MILLKCAKDENPNEELGQGVILIEKGIQMQDMQ